MIFSSKYKIAFSFVLILFFIFFSGLFTWKKGIIVFKKHSFSSFIPEKEYSKLTLSTPYDESLEILETNFPNQFCNILDYGAVADGKTINTQSIEKAIVDCAKKGGGHVVVPVGVFLSGPIQLKSNIDLHLEKNSEIRFSVNFSDYLPVVFSRFEGIEYYNFSPQVYARNAKNIAITGEGKLNGQGQAWWGLRIFSNIKNLYRMGEQNLPVEERVFGDANKGIRPSFIEFVDSEIILLDGISIINGPMWTVHPIYSENIIIRNIKINTLGGPSTDGVVIDSSRNVLVENSTFATGDDAIAIKSGRDNDGRRVSRPSENIVLRNCIVNEAHGAVAIGSEISGDIRNILAQNFTINMAQYGFRMKANSQRGGIAENIWIKDFSIRDVRNALIQLNANYEKKVIEYTTFPPVFQNINISNIVCENTLDSINILGISESTLKDIRLTNISIGKSKGGVKVSNASNVKLTQISIGNKTDPNFTFTDSQDIFLENSACNPSDPICVSLFGEKTRNIYLTGQDFDKDFKKIQLDHEVDEKQIFINGSLSPISS